MAIAEWFGATEGLGYLVYFAGQTLNIPVLFVGVAVFAALGILGFEAVRAVLRRARAESTESADESQAPQYPVNVDLQGDEEPVPCDGEVPGDCDVPEEPCDECPTTTVTVPPTTPTVPPSSETTVATTPSTSVMAATPPAEELPRTGSTVTPFVVAGAALLALGAALVASKRFALGRR